MRKFIKTFDDYENQFVPFELNVTKEGIANLGNQFLREIGKNYKLGGDKDFNKKKGNCGWFTQEFYQWAENNKTPCRIIYFPETKKAKEAHIAILIGELVLDFTHKQFSKDPKEKFSVLPIKDYKKYGYLEDKIEILDEFPNWVTDLYPPEKKD